MEIQPKPLYVIRGRLPLRGQPHLGRWGQAAGDRDRPPQGQRDCTPRCAQGRTGIALPGDVGRWRAESRTGPGLRLLHDVVRSHPPTDLPPNKDLVRNPRSASDPEALRRPRRGKPSAGAGAVRESALWLKTRDWPVFGRQYEFAGGAPVCEGAAAGHRGAGRQVNARSRCATTIRPTRRCPPARAETC